MNEDMLKTLKVDFYNCLPLGNNICSQINLTCPYGKKCISTDINHFIKFFHGSSKRLLKCYYCLKVTSHCLSKFYLCESYAWICKECYLPYRCCDKCSYRSLGEDYELSNCELSNFGYKKMENGELIQVPFQSAKQCCIDCPMYQELEIHYQVDLKYKDHKDIIKKTDF